MPIRFFRALPYQFFITFIRKFGPNKRVVARGGDFLAGYAPTVAHPFLRLANYGGPVFDFHFGLSNIHSDFRQKWFQDFYVVAYQY